MGPSSYIINESTGIGVTASNIARNLALHVGTPVAAFNDAIHRAITKFVNAIGEDVNNPRTTWMGTRFEPPRLSRHEATAGNPLHALALILSLGLLLRHGRRCRELRSSLFLAIGLTLAFFMFCAVLKWQPWHSRLHAPLFVIGSAVTATVLERSWPRSVSVALGVALFVFAVSMVLTNQLRPLVGPYSIFDMSRQDLYFSDRRDLMHAYVSAVKHIDTLGCEVVGLDTSAEDFPYPLLALLKSPQRVFRNVNVTNGSKMYSHSEEDKLPCAVLCPKCLGTPAFDALAPGFSSIRMFDHVVVLAGTPESANHTCAISFRSWYGRESEGSTWWRWCSGTSFIDIILPRDTKVSLTGEWMSVLQPNSVALFVNGENAAQIDIGNGGVTRFEALPLRLRKGVNTIEVRSKNPGRSILRDRRKLAIAIRNLSALDQNGSACSVQ